MDSRVQEKLLGKLRTHKVEGQRVEVSTPAGASWKAASSQRCLSLSQLLADVLLRADICSRLPDPGLTANNTNFGRT